MILSEIRDYIRTRQQATLRDVALHFDIDHDVARGMLEFWVKKNRIRKTVSSACSGSCSCDAAQETESYSWNPSMDNIPIVIKH